MNWVAPFCLLLALASCTKSTAPVLSPDADRGRITYQAYCIACHNADPHKTGAVGPEVFGSSLELIEARVLRAEYPPGYHPKRETHAMTAFPQLKEQIPALHAYLNSAP